MSAGDGSAPCLNPGHGTTTIALGSEGAGEGTEGGLELPWSGDPRAADKGRLLAIIASEGPRGLAIVEAAQLLVGQQLDSQSSDVRFAHRFVDAHPELFDTWRNGERRWVSAKRAALDLTQLKRSSRTSKTAGSGALSRSAKDTLETLRDVWGIDHADHADPDHADHGDHDQGDQHGTGGRYPRDKARAYLGRVGSVGSPSTRAGFVRSLSTYARQTGDKFAALEHRGVEDPYVSYDPASEPRYLFIPHTSRHTDRGTAGELLGKYHGVWNRTAADESVTHAVALTLTVDPSLEENGDIEGQLEALRETKGKLLSWLAYDPVSGPSRIGRRPDHLSVLEFTDAGRPHLHVICFDTAWLATKQELSSYLADKCGRIVDVATLRSGGRSSSWSWSTNADRPADAITDGGVISPRSYYGKAVYDLTRVASMDHDQLGELADAIRSEDVDAADAELWKQGLYWALGARYYTGTQDLLDPPSTTDADADADVSSSSSGPRYRYLGTYRYASLPDHMRDNGVFLGCPPDGKLSFQERRAGDGYVTHASRGE